MVLDDFIDAEENFAQTAAIAEVLLGDQSLSDKQKSALAQLLGHDISDDEQGRARAINELLNRRGTGHCAISQYPESVSELISGFKVGAQWRTRCRYR